MTTTEWIICGLSALLLVCGLLSAASSRLLAPGAWAFSLGIGTGLVLTYLKLITAYHLLWIVPVAFLLGVVLFFWRATAMIGAGVDQVRQIPRLKKGVQQAFRGSAAKARRDKKPPSSLRERI